MTIAMFRLGGKDQVSYATLDEADAIAAGDLELRAAWAALVDPNDPTNTTEKEAHLVWGTRQVDLYRPFTGNKKDPDQETEWPRENVLCEGEPVSAELPGDIETAAVYLALRSAFNLASVINPMHAAQLSEIKAGTVELKYHYNVAQNTLQRSQQLNQDDNAVRLIRCYQQARVGVGNIYSENFGGSSDLGIDEYEIRPWTNYGY